jgi:hypothetical protein
MVSVFILKVTFRPGSSDAGLYNRRVTALRRTFEGRPSRVGSVEHYSRTSVDLTKSGLLRMGVDAGRKPHTRIGRHDRV